MNDPFSWLMFAVLAAAAAMWLFTLVAGLLLTLHAWVRDSFSLATAATACAGLHVLFASFTKYVQIVYLPAALIVLVMAAVAGTRSLLRSSTAEAGFERSDVSG